MKQLFYRIIYSAQVNLLLRNLNKFLLPLLPVRFKIPPSGELILKNDQGKSLKLATNQTNFLTYLLFWEGGFHRFEYTDIFIELIKRINTFYDIGANIGYYSLIGSLENPSARIVAFEPAEGPLFYLKKNVKLNDFKNIRVESIALSDVCGEIDFYEVTNKKYKYLKYNLAGESNAGSKTKSRDFRLNRVKSLTLDDFVKENQEDRIDLIKMDTEGTEHFILGKSEFVLKEMKPIVICETLFNAIEPKLEKIFSKFGYEFYNHSGNNLVKQNTIVRKADNGIRNCFFVHPEKYYLIESFVSI